MKRAHFEALSWSNLLRRSSSRAAGYASLRICMGDHTGKWPRNGTRPRRFVSGFRSDPDADNIEEELTIIALVSRPKLDLV